MKIFHLFIPFLLFFSCSQYRTYQQVLKSTDPDYQYTQAVSYFNNADYARSLELFENLLIVFKGDELAEDIYYYYIYANFYLKDYMSTIYHADNFVSNFVLSSKKEEIAYLSAYCHYLDTPRFSLDQKNTLKAITELERFVMNFPESDSLQRITDLVLDLNNKLEKKYFENAKLYYETGKYKSAIFAIDYFLTDYPETSFLEEISFIQVQAYYELGKNSIDEKKLQRIKEAIFACDNFLIAFAEGVYYTDAKNIYKKLKDIENGL